MCTTPYRSSSSKVEFVVMVDDDVIYILDDGRRFSLNHGFLKEVVL